MVSLVATPASRSLVAPGRKPRGPRSGDCPTFFGGGPVRHFIQRVKQTKSLAAMSKRKCTRKKRARALKAGQPVLNPNTHADAGGIDIGSTEVVAAVPAERDATPVRTFSAFTSGVLALRDWLLACGIKTVAVESTGNYWITVYDVLEEA